MGAPGGSMAWVSRLLQPLPGPCRCNRSSPKYILLRYGNSLYFFPIFFPYSSQGRFHRWLEAILALKHNDYSSCVFRGFPIFFRVAFTDGIEPLPPEQTGLRPEGWGTGWHARDFLQRPSGGNTPSTSPLERTRMPQDGRARNIGGLCGEQHPQDDYQRAACAALIWRDHSRSAPTLNELPEVHAVRRTSAGTSGPQQF